MPIWWQIWGHQGSVGVAALHTLLSPSLCVLVPSDFQGGERFPKCVTQQGDSNPKDSSDPCGRDGCWSCRESRGPERCQEPPRCSEAPAFHVTL